MSLTCEGDAESALANHIKWKYWQRDYAYSINIGNAHGGSSTDTVKCAIKTITDHKYAFIDTDRPEVESTRMLAKKHRITLIESHPCLEAEVLKIMGVSITGVGNFKSVFRKNFPKWDLTNHEHYGKFISEGIWMKLEESDTIFGKLIKLHKYGKI